jgi:hypothetical protein
MVLTQNPRQPIWTMKRQLHLITLIIRPPQSIPIMRARQLTWNMRLRPVRRAKHTGVGRRPLLPLTRNMRKAPRLTEDGKRPPHLLTPSTRRAQLMEDGKKAPRPHIPHTRKAPRHPIPHTRRAQHLTPHGKRAPHPLIPHTRRAPRHPIPHTRRAPRHPIPHTRRAPRHPIPHTRRAPRHPIPHTRRAQHLTPHGKRAPRHPTPCTKRAHLTPHGKRALHLLTPSTHQPRTVDTGPGPRLQATTKDILKKPLAKRAAKFLATRSGLQAPRSTQLQSLLQSTRFRLLL